MGSFEEGRAATRRRDRYRRVKPTASSAAGVGPFMVQELPDGTEMGATAYPEYKGYDRERGEHVFAPGQYIAPLDPSTVSLAIRMHENGHLITMKKKLLPRYVNNIMERASRESIDQMWLQGIFDVYVNRYMQNRDVDEVGDLPFDTLDDQAPIWVFAQTWLRAGCRRNNDWRQAHQGIHDRLSKIEKELLAAIERRIHQHADCAATLGEDQILDMAAQMQDIFGKPDDQEDSGEYESVEDRQQAAAEQEDENGSLQEALEEALEESGGEWGDCSIVQMNRSRRVRTALRALRPRAGYVGAFRFPNRAHPLTSDGRCFGQKKKVPGGTILFDVSGSMDLSEKQIQTLIDAAPAATIACYSSKVTNHYEEGHVVVIAHRGMYSEPRKWKSLFGPNNLVDGPALAWLQRQEAPRIWVSDGQVNGRSNTTRSMITDILKMMRRGKIRRIPTPEDAIDFIKGFSSVKPSDGLPSAYERMAGVAPKRGNRI